MGGRWVIIDTDHPSKPEDYELESSELRDGICPFCYGNEAMTPPEVAAMRDPATAADKPGWQVRVVSNKFPALQIEGDLDRRGVGIYDMSNGVGAHEILIETPDHRKDIPDLSDREVENIINMYCRRTLELAKDERFKYILIFKNYGAAAGASLAHPHSQMIALPMVPKSVAEEIKGARRYFEYRERCLFCDVIRQEIEDRERIILENEYFLSYCPFVSRFPFEICIIPKHHYECFCRTPHEQFAALASILKGTVTKLKRLFPQLAYNYMIHTSPINGDGIEGYHWHLEFMPKLTRVAGFEWGSGFYSVSTPPEMAAQYLRDQG